jgi:hypothetical protein
MPKQTREQLCILHPAPCITLHGIKAEEADKEHGGAAKDRVLRVIALWLSLALFDDGLVGLSAVEK